MSKTKRLVTGSALRVAGFFASTIIGIMLMPFIIHSLGDNDYGLWILIGSFLGYYGLLDLGFSYAVKRYVSRAIAQKDYDDVNKTMNTALFIFSAMGAAAAFATVAIIIIVPMAIHSIPDVALFRKVVFILGLGIALGFPLNVFSGFLTADIKFDLQAGIELGKLAVRTILVIIYLKLGYGIMALTVITFVTDMAGYGATYVAVRRLYGYLKLTPKLIDRQRIGMLFNYSIFAFVAQIADQLRFNIQNVILAAFAGLQAVTVYSIGFRLVRYFKDFIVSALGMTMPVFSQYEGAGDYETIRRQYIFLTKISSFLSLFAGSALIFFGGAFITRWLGSSYSDAYTILLILVIPFMIDMMQPCNGLLYGLSKHRFVTVMNCSEGVLNLALSLLLVKKYGIFGIAYATAIPMLITRVFIQPFYICKVIGMRYRDFWISLMIPIGGLCFSVLLLYWFAVRNYIIPEYLKLFLLVCLECAVFSPIVFKFGFDDREKQYFFRLLTVRS